MATVHRTDEARRLSRSEKPQVTSEILDRQPPRNLEAERGVLGSILLLPDCADDVALVLRADDFYDDAHRKLYQCMLDMHTGGQRIDTTLLVESLRSRGDLELIGGMVYLAEIARAVPNAAHAVYYANIVRDKSTLRQLIFSGTEILRDAYDDSTEPRDMRYETQ